MPTPLRLLTRGSWSESQRFSEILRKETVGGVLLLVAAGAALVWANSPWSDDLPRGVGVRVRPGVAASAPVRFGVGGRRAVGDLLLRRRAGAQARVRRRRPARSAPSRPADRGRHRRHDRARRHLHRDQPGRRPPEEPRRVGGADRHRHRVRARGARGAVHPPADRAAHLSADSRSGRRSARHHRHRRLLHRSPVAGPARAGADPDRTVRAGGAARDASLVAAGAAGRRRRGRWCTPAGCTRRSRACVLGFTVPVLGRHGQPDRRTVRTHAAAGVRGLRGARVRVLRRRSDGRRLVRPRRLAAAPGHRRRDRRPGDRQAPRRVRHRVPVGQVHPRQPR